MQRLEPRERVLIEFRRLDDDAMEGLGRLGAAEPIVVDGRGASRQFHPRRGGKILARNDGRECSREFFVPTATPGEGLQLVGKFVFRRLLAEDSANQLEA